MLKWIDEIIERKMVTINMLGCHDGIPVLDLRGRRSAEGGDKTLLSDEEIDGIVTRIMDRGGRVKNLYGPDGKKISYYQVNATFFSALGEDERKLLLARAIQMFVPGIPQVWYLDLFAGKNNYVAADNAGAAGHKEINRTTLELSDIEAGLKQPVVLKQLQLMKLRNTSPAFEGNLEISRGQDNRLQLTWRNGNALAALDADLDSYSFSITHTGASGEKEVLSFE